MLYALFYCNEMLWTGEMFHYDYISRGYQAME